MIDALGAESLDDLQFITVSDMKALGMPGESMGSGVSFVVTTTYRVADCVLAGIV